MRLSQVLVVAAASFLFASEAIAVTMDSNQAKISTVARGGPSQRLLRSYSKTVEDDSDDLADYDDLNELEERSTSADAAAKSLGHSLDDIVNGVVKLTSQQKEQYRVAFNAALKAKKKAERDAFNAAWRAENGL